jgi:hypothetical protein
MTRRAKLTAALAAAAAAAILPIAASADSCANVSRAPAPCGFSCPAPVIEGNWVWLPSIGVPVPGWGFAPPGAPDSVAFGFPGSSGNYQNTQVTGNQSLLDNSATCAKPGTDSRQTTHGIQSGCE